MDEPEARFNFENIVNIDHIGRENFEFLAEQNVLSRHLRTTSMETPKISFICETEKNSFRSE
jgi:hypothetical protein